MLESGYDRTAIEAERTVSPGDGHDLRVRIAGVSRGGRVQRGPGGAKPPIDEVAEMTFPVDPKLRQRAEEAAKSVSHDLPLTGTTWWLRT